MIKTKAVITSYCCTLALLSSCWADKPPRLTKIEQNIVAVKATINQNQSKLNNQQQQLATIETELASLDQILTSNQQQLQQTGQTLSKLQLKNTQLEKSLQQQQKTLAEQLVSSYKTGEQPLLKLLLSQESPEYLQRHLMYYRYFNTQRIESINKLKNTIYALQGNTDEIQQQQMQLTATVNKNRQDKINYHKRFKQRQVIISQLSGKIDDQQQQLQQLLNKKLAQAKASYKAKQKSRRTTANNKLFTQRKGKYPWPTPGRLVAKFGSNIANSQLKRDGILIRANIGQPVRAIANGRIIFSKWMSGYGLLVIIDHGNGYMSLYGRNQTLLASDGDSVQAGQIIATVGNTGGYKNSSLYFAIRHNAKPLNPTQWCHKA